MSDLLDLLDWAGAPDWEPIYQPSVESVGWHVTPDKNLPQHADETPVGNAEWNQYLASFRCRDCGGPVKHERGGTDTGGWTLCRECGVIVDCTAAWGGPSYNHTEHTLDELHVRQGRRRANHKKAVA